MNDTLKEVREWRERVMELCEPTEGDGRGSNFQREQRAIQAGWALALRCEALQRQNDVLRRIVATNTSRRGETELSSTLIVGQPSVSAGEEKE